MPCRSTRAMTGMATDTGSKAIPLVIQSELTQHRVAPASTVIRLFAGYQRPRAHHIGVREHGLHGPRGRDSLLQLPPVAAVRQPQGVQEQRRRVEDVDQRRRNGDAGQGVLQAADGHLRV